ncbi:TPM domain-containing protein [Methylocella sp.]|uniref:TPM domain-containing protein n=1 Tax=Methylocella sp. TaxID=1978226 RepID=UPI0037831623
MRAPALAAQAARRLLGAALVLLALAAAAAAYDFPKLSGRVVDAAGVIPAPARTALAQKLAALEEKSGIQLVVATVPSLEGDEIEPYANALFRAWGLGEKDRNNGVLMLVAPNEKRVRIEVGYGLEGTLTDALSRVVIANAMAPRFKAGDFGGGIERGVDDVITILTTDSAEWEKRPDLRLDRAHGADDELIPFIFFGLFLIVVFLMLRAPRRRALSSDDPRWGDPRRAQTQAFWANVLGSMLASGSRRGGGFDDWGGGGGGFGGGFSGGGGSSGGGGASGSW